MVTYNDKNNPLFIYLFIYYYFAPLHTYLYALIDPMLY